MSTLAINLKDVIKSINSHCKELIEFYESNPDELDNKIRNPNNLDINQIKQQLQSLSLQTIRNNIDAAKQYVNAKINRNRDGKFNDKSNKSNKKASNKIKVKK